MTRVDECKEIINEFCCREDYLGLPFSVPQITRAFGFGINTARKAIRQSGLNPIGAKSLYFLLTPADNCWVKFGITLKGYISSRARWLTQDEMAEELGVSKYTIKRLLRKFKIKERCRTVYLAREIWSRRKKF